MIGDFGRFVKKFADLHPAGVKRRKRGKGRKGDEGKISSKLKFGRKEIKINHHSPLITEETLMAIKVLFYATVTGCELAVSMFGKSFQLMARSNNQAATIRVTFGKEKPREIVLDPYRFATKKRGLASVAYEIELLLDQGARVVLYNFDPERLPGLGLGEEVSKNNLTCLPGFPELEDLRKVLA